MYELADEQIALQDLAQTFATREVRPIAKERDADPHLADRFPWSVLEKASNLGLRTLALSPNDGGVGLDLMTQCLVFEQLALGDLGFATTLDQTWRLSPLLTRSDAARTTLLPMFQRNPRMLLALADERQGARSPKVTASGDREWLIDGESKGVIAGGVAGLLLVKAETTSGTTSIVTVATDQPGFRAELVDKAGRRLEPTADIWMVGCAVTGLVGDEGDGTALVQELRERYAPVTAMGAVAVARAAYELAVDWARRRIQGGKVIAEHPSVAMKIGDMCAAIEASRSLALQAAWAIDHRAATADALATAATILSAQTTNRVCYDAMQIWGGMGFMREGGMEKFTRDAVGFYSGSAIDAARERLGRLAAAGKPIC